MPLPDCHWLANEEEDEKDNVSKAHIHIHSRAPSNDLIVERERVGRCALGRLAKQSEVIWREHLKH